MTVQNVWLWINTYFYTFLWTTCAFSDNPCWYLPSSVLKRYKTHLCIFTPLDYFVVEFTKLPLSCLQGCVTNGDCGKGRYCLYDTNNPKCVPCKAVDVVGELKLQLRFAAAALQRVHRCNWSVPFVITVSCELHMKGQHVSRLNLISSCPSTPSKHGENKYNLVGRRSHWFNSMMVLA